MSRAPHLRNLYSTPGRYVELFGHLLRPWSSDEWKKRFAELAEEDKLAKPNNGLRMAQLQKK